METRRLGNTDLHLTEIGLGTWAIGGGNWKFSWGLQDDEESVRTIRRAMDLGVNWIDTAAVYGLGHSEEIVGKAIQGMRQRPIVATKCERCWDKHGQIYPCLKRKAGGKTAACLAIAWVLRRPEVTAAIVGARKPLQTEETVGAAGWRLSPEDLAAVDALLARRASVG
jgi:aryl-alcohol dehydrogenase-like predicted oxidoreductase